MKRVLVVRTGSVNPPIRARLGDFPEWFARHLSPRVEVATADALTGALPEHGQFDGIVVTGSLASVTRPEPWMHALGAYLLDAARRAPILGVCFGHQLLAVALGGEVERNPRGPEAGTSTVEITDAGRRDPLFAGLPVRLAVQQSHEDHVPSPPPGAVLLAGNAHAPVQAFAHGPRIRSVQFHPEFDAVRTRAILDADRVALDAARHGLAEEALAGVRETPEAERVLANWVSSCVGA